MRAVSRSLPTTLTALLLSLTAVAAPSSPEQEAAVLVEQADRLAASDRPEVALGLYRAAALLAPDAPAPHLGVARVLRAQGRCDEAVIEYRLWMSLVPQPPPSPDLYTEAVVELGECLRQTAAVLEIETQRPIGCSIDGGTPRQAAPGTPLIQELSAGPHTVSCGDDIIAPLTLAAGARKVLRIDPDGRLVSLVRLRSDPAARCSLDGGGLFEVTREGSQWLVAPGEHRLDCTAEGHAPVSQLLTVEVAGEHDVALTPVPTVEPGLEPWPPVPETQAELPAPPLPELEPEPEPAVVSNATRGEVEIRTEGPGWTCRIGELVRTPTVAGEIFIELDPGDYTLDCEQARALPVSQPFSLAAGERVVIDVVWTPRPAPPPPPQEERRTMRPGELEWMIGAGLGPSLGTVGLSVGARLDTWSLQLGTGVDPVALSVGYHFQPGGNGLYVIGGWTRVGRGVLRGGDVPSGHGFHSGAGMELRLNRFLVRLGAGLAVSTNGFGSGPLTFDLSGYWLP